jgi:hypothetical protein
MPTSIAINKKKRFIHHPYQTSTAITKNQQKMIPSPSIHESIFKKIGELEYRKSERIEDDIRCGRAFRPPTPPPLRSPAKAPAPLTPPEHASRCAPVNSRRRRAVAGMSSRAHATVVEVADEGRHCRCAD